MTLTAMEHAVARLTLRVVGGAAALAILSAAAALAVGAGAALLSIGAGFMTAAASFAILAWVVVRTMPGDPGSAPRRSTAFVAVLGCVKLAAIGCLLWWLLRRGLLEPLAFLAGFTTIIAALLFAGLSTWRAAAKG
jgi:hypothetical protein